MKPSTRPGRGTRSTFLARAPIAAAFVAMLALSLSACRETAGTVVMPRAIGATEPLPINEVDDAAIWVHPTDPAQSLLLVTNERRGLEIHEMDGLLVKQVADGYHPNNVDLLYGFDDGGKVVDLVLASCLAPDHWGVRIWSMEPATRKLVDVNGGAVVPVFDATEPLGLCAYRSRKTGKGYFFVTMRRGRIEQYELAAQPGGRIDARRVRSFARPTKTEGCVADEERGLVYFAEEDVGVWRYPAEPDGATEGELVIQAGDHGLTPDIEGLALYGASGGRGYLIVVSQRSKRDTARLLVYRREGQNEFVLTVDPKPAGAGSIERTSGVAVTNRPTIAALGRGCLVVNDHLNDNATEDFKIYAWEDVALPGGLLIDTDWSPRR